MNGDEKVVVVDGETANVKMFWLSEDIISCDLDRLKHEQQAKDDIRDQLENDDIAKELSSETRDALVNLIDDMAQSSAKCQLQESLEAALPHCDTQHDKQCIVVSINPARTSWSEVYRHILPVLLEYLNTDSIEKEGW